ncbi:Protein lines [Amphibalanus amphitrite]|uniref:Protein lines n=1 Tax=Amphibalanus amphitrite TaxID=1232801 RepID=A0A6A4X001_AMPAM|nr:Protein lines [Amphibalanus amphitrite]
MTESRLDVSGGGPAAKRPRLASPGPTARLDDPLAALHERAQLGCLCPLPAAQLTALTAQLSAADSRRQLLALSTLQLLQEAALQQLRLGSMCRQLQRAVCAQRQADGPLLEALLALLASGTALLSCGAGRCLTLAALLLPPGRAQRLLEALVAAVLESERQLEVCHALNALQRLIEQHDPPESAAGGARPLPAGCAAISVGPDPETLSEIKCAITALLENRWVPVTQRFCRLLTRPAHETEVLAFLRLWTTIISVKNNLSIVETKSFYGRLEGLMSSLGGDASPHVWRAVLDLYAEVLCYGSTIALQDCVAEEPAGLAHALLRQTRAGRLLEAVPYERGVRAFAGSSSGGAGGSGGDRPLMQKTVLLVLKALAVTVKETRCESSSEASARSAGGSGSEEQDMVIIERTLREVVRRLDGWVKARLPFHPETPMSEWAVVLLCDQDDYLVEAMVCLLDLCAGLAERARVQPDFERAIDAHRSFVQFLGTVRRDHDLLLDFLISNETCFLLYLLRYLKFVRKHWARFLRACGAKLQEVMGVLIGLRISLQQLVARDLFPYNVTPILKLLERCEQLYEHNPAAG